MPERLTGGTPDKWAQYIGKTYPNGVSIIGESGSYIELIDCDVSNPTGPGLVIGEGAHSFLVQGGRYHDCVRDGDGRGGGIWVGIPFADFDVRGVIDGVEADHCEVAGINAEGNAWRGQWLSGLTVKNCYIHHIFGNPDEVSWTRTGVGIYWTTCKDCNAFDNIVHDCTMTGIHADCDTGEVQPSYPCTELWWIGNKVWNCGMNLVEVEGGHGVLIRYNRLMGGAGWNWQTGATTGYCHAVCLSMYALRNIIERNIITDEEGGYTGPICDVRIESEGNEFDHNTFYCPSVGKPAIGLYDTPATKCRITNNIINRVLLAPTLSADYYAAHNMVGDWPDLAANFVDPVAYDVRLKPPPNPCIGAGEGGSDIGALAFEEDGSMPVTLTEEVVQVNTAILDVVQASPNQVQLVRKNTDGSVQKILETKTLVNNMVVDETPIPSVALTGYGGQVPAAAAW